VSAALPAWATDPGAANDPTWRLGEQLQDDRADLRKGNALVQSPDFIVDFILDLTYKPAVEEFGLAGVTLIDPSCGTGNFLTAAFMRTAAGYLAMLRPFTPPGMEPSGRTRAAMARDVLRQIAGVDIDPDCTDLARHRLTVLANQLAGLPDDDTSQRWLLQVACADSLLHGPASDGALPPDGHCCGDRDCAQALDILGRTYAVVVGNPPYITVKDPARNAAYRARYDACSGKYSLSVPFTQLMFGLAHRGAEAEPATSGQGALDLEGVPA
jgi:hypothetical protein